MSEVTEGARVEYFTHQGARRVGTVERLSGRTAVIDVQGSSHADYVDVERLTVLPTVAYGTVRMSYHMEPCTDSDGMVYAHGGNHYADANTLERAREYARDMIGGHISYCGCGAVIRSVVIYGRNLIFKGDAWHEYREDLQHSREVIR